MSGTGSSTGVGAFTPIGGVVGGINCGVGTEKCQRENLNSDSIIPDEINHAWYSLVVYF